MKKILADLKKTLTISALLLSFSAYAKEIRVNTTQGECFFFNVNSDVSLDEITHHIQRLTENENSSFLIEVPFKEDLDAEPASWGWNVKKHGQFLGYPRNYYAQMSVQERNDIHHIVTFLANKSLLTIASHKGNLEDAGDRIDHIHPLRFLMTVFSNEELKVGIRNIRGKGWIWGDFISGLKESLATESNIQNMKEEYIYDFSRTVEIDPKLIMPSMYARRWDEFIDLLITHIPRKGDYNRYDS